MNSIPALSFLPATARHSKDVVTAVTESYLDAQVRAGAQAIQLFDTWAGLLDVETYREFGLRYARRVLDRLGATGHGCVTRRTHRLQRRSITSPVSAISISKTE